MQAIKHGMASTSQTRSANAKMRVDFHAENLPEQALTQALHIHAAPLSKSVSTSILKTLKHYHHKHSTYTF
eukprot:UN3328